MRRIAVVGAGFAGATAARMLADAGFYVDVYDRRLHVAGNAFDEVDPKTGIRFHRYGPHLFHTSNQRVVDYLSRFTEWTPYEHRAKALLKGGVFVPFPVNAETAAAVGGTKEAILDTFFRPYNRKMWGLELEQMDPNILKRVPIRQDNEDRYFPNDTFQALPKDGYENLIVSMLSHMNIDVHLGKTWPGAGGNTKFHHVFTSQPIDEYYLFVYGNLDYRSIRFNHRTVDVPAKGYFYMPAATVNFTNDGPYTRVTEWARLPGHRPSNDIEQTLLTFEEPCDYRENNFERYYPVKDPLGRNATMLAEYQRVAARSKDVTHIGRCGQYVYLDMHQCVSSTMATVERYIKATM